MTESKIPGEFAEKYPDSVVKERFKRIWDKIEESWGSQECVDFLDELVVMEGDKQRQGFDLNVMSELLHLAQMHNREFPQFAVPKLGDDVWDTDFTHG